MAINVTLGEAKTQNKKHFPKLMIHEDGCVMFFIKENTGICLIPGGGTVIGYFTQTMNMDRFTDYNEPITIQNA